MRLSVHALTVKVTMCREASWVRLAAMLFVACKKRSVLRECHGTGDNGISPGFITFHPGYAC